LNKETTEKTNNENESFGIYSLAVLTIEEVLNDRVNLLPVAFVEVEINSLIPKEEYEKFKGDENSIFYDIVYDYNFYNAQVNEIMYKDDGIDFDKDIIFCFYNLTTFNDGDKFICILVNPASLTGKSNPNNVYGALVGDNTIF